MGDYDFGREVLTMAIILLSPIEGDTKMPKLPVEAEEPEKIVEGDSRMAFIRREE